MCLVWRVLFVLSCLVCPVLSCLRAAFALLSYLGPFVPGPVKACGTLVFLAAKFPPCLPQNLLGLVAHQFPGSSSYCALSATMLRSVRTDEIRTECNRSEFAIELLLYFNTMLKAPVFDGQSRFEWGKWYMTHNHHNTQISIVTPQYSHNITDIPTPEKKKTEKKNWCETLCFVWLRIGTWRSSCM